MSYARMSGEYSDIYLFATWYQPKGKNIVWECMSCRLKTISEHNFYPSYHIFNLKAVYRHLRHHHYAHHRIPHYTWRRVLMEYWDIPIDRMLELSADYASLRD